jgi:hypothetical protein
VLAGRYDRVEDLRADGLQRARVRRMRAQFFEWAAIAAAQLGRPPEVVGERFARAVTEDPFEPRIQSNAASWEAWQGARRQANKQVEVSASASWELSRQLDDTAGSQVGQPVRR